MSVKDLCEKMGFRVLEGSLDLEEEWISPNTLKLTGIGEMGSPCGASLKAPLTIHVEIGDDYQLDITGQQSMGKTA